MVHNSYGDITCFSGGTVVMDRTFRRVIFCKLEPYSGFFFVTTTASTIGANTSSLNTNTTSSSSKG